MKKQVKLLCIFVLAIILCGCSSSKIKEITYNDLVKSIENKETFILEIVQDGCSNCEAFSPKFKKIVDKYELDVKSLNLSKLSKEDSPKLNNLFKITGTPTVLFITKGKEEYIYRRIVGDVSEDIIITKLTKAGYIK